MILLLLLFASPTIAQPLPIDNIDPALPPGTARNIVTAASYAPVVYFIARDVILDLRSDHPIRSTLVSGGKLSLTWLAADGIKVLVHRERPCAPLTCGLDNPNASFYSLHTAFVATEAPHGWQWAVFVPITAQSRVWANRHWLTDTIAGAAAGGLVSLIPSGR